MTITLTPDEEAKLAAIAEGRGVSPDAFLKGIVTEILETSQFSAIGETQADERERQLEELFATLDEGTIPDGVREEAFHRENWY